MAKIKTIKLVVGDTLPQLHTLKREGTVIDLTGATVTLILVKGSTVKNSGHQNCTVNAPTSGIIQYNPGTSDFDTPGTYRADVHINYGSYEETMYDELKFKVRRRVNG